LTPVIESGEAIEQTSRQYRKSYEGCGRKIQHLDGFPADSNPLNPAGSSIANSAGIQRSLWQPAVCLW